MNRSGAGSLLQGFTRPHDGIAPGLLGDGANQGDKVTMHIARLFFTCHTNPAARMAIFVLKSLNRIFSMGAGGCDVLIEALLDVERTLERTVTEAVELERCRLNSALDCRHWPRGGSRALVGDN